ncbi:MAG TPA: MFS transporter, partial [Vicinamibacterales bacterium]|nr:MFS transporter [Vicinamibacterales bacterium]
TAVTPALVAEFHLSPGQVAWLTMAVQGGFVAGTIVSAVLTLPDVVATRRLFAIGCVAGAAATAAITQVDSAGPAIVLRLLTGAALAWVYPTGLKIAAGWFRGRRGTALAVLVGALTVGQAFPHLLAAVFGSTSWRAQLLVTAALAVAGGVLVVLVVRDGPFDAPAGRFDPRAALLVFRRRATRLALLGYLGHQWELYAMWTWVGTFAAASFAHGGMLQVDRLASAAAFTAVATGAVGCLVAGIAADRRGKARVAGWALRTSGSCAALTPLFFGAPPAVVFLFVAVWGLVVVADSAQFSALIADYSPPRYVGTALTVETCAGYLLTMMTIRVIPSLTPIVGWQWAFLALVPGPVLGAWAMRRLQQDGR